MIQRHLMCIGVGATLIGTACSGSDSPSSVADDAVTSSATGNPASSAGSGGSSSIGQGGSGGEQGASSSTSSGSSQGGSGNDASSSATTTSGSGGQPPHGIVSCPAPGSSAAGHWEDATPSGLNLDPNYQTPAGGNFGAHAFVVDPTNTATVYLGTSAQGIFKSTDCGANWILVSKGDVNKGRNGSMVIDPIDPQVIYTDARYGPLGLFKSTNGGVDWTQILPQDILSVFPSVEWIAMDPSDHEHLVVVPHFMCMGAHDGNCMVETMDAGATWKIHDGTPEATEFSGIVMVDAKTWLVAQPFGGIYRTGDGGASWKQVYMGGAAPFIYKAADGTYYMPGNLAGVLASKDTIQWTAIASAGQSSGLAAGKSALFSSLGLNNTYASSAPFSDLTKWAQIEMLPGGAFMLQGDPDHDIIYSSGFLGGFHRYVVP